MLFELYLGLPSKREEINERNWIWKEAKELDAKMESEFLERV